MKRMRSASAPLAAALLAAFLVRTAAADEEFPTVVTDILNGQTEGPISQMGDEKKEAVIACVNTTLVELPAGRKRYIVEGESFEEREQRFGKVLFENRAEWIQKIARACASVALSGGRAER